MQLGLMPDRALFQAVSHFHLISDAHVLFLNSTHGTFVIKITLEKFLLKSCLFYRVIIIAPIHYFHPSVTQMTENFPVRIGRTERHILTPGTKI